MATAIATATESAMRPLLLLPEILLFVGGLTALLGGSFLARDRQWVTRVVAALALLGAGVAAALSMGGPAQPAFEGSFTVDTTTGIVRLLVALGTLLVLGLATDEIAASPRESETYALLLFSATGTLVLAGADDILVLVVGFLLASIPLYGLIGLAGGAVSAEAAMKTYLLGALFGIVLMGGVTVLYGVTGTTGYAELADRLPDAPAGAVAAGVLAVLVGLMFKAGGVPAHFWIPDAAQGTTVTAAAFLTTVPKIGAVIAAYRLVLTLPDTLAWPLLVAVLATVGMTLGNLAAYWQSDPRRLLGWSTVSQVGFLLVPVVVAGASDLALPSLLVYLTGYTVTNIAAFAVTAALPQRRTLESYRGLGRDHPWLSLALVVALLGLLGTPPTAVFAGKLTTATAAWDGGWAWLAIVVLVNTLLSLFYYLRWIVQPFRSGETACKEPTAPLPWSTSTALVAAVLSVALGIGAGLVWAVVAG
ncbi:MAG: NADH-quinone oxidoreductase subunit N [Ornithinimicrobium sp.]|uniref:NADH-quinone oxidoreductase subunit N n=1 Tax=Ornithinimicrobium sp. TaxID=1977084 RepID=UPI003D9B8651